jgi:hypothetical protein
MVCVVIRLGQRRNLTAEFKSKADRATIRGEKALSEQAEQF